MHSANKFIDPEGLRAFSVELLFVETGSLAKKGLCLFMLNLLFMMSKSKEGIDKMPTCQNCDQKWGWNQTLRISFTLDTGMICPYCEKKQYTTKSTRIKNFLITFIAMSVITFWSLFFGSSFAFIFISTSFVPLSVILYPFWVELSNKEEF